MDLASNTLEVVVVCENLAENVRVRRERNTTKLILLNNPSTMALMYTILQNNRKLHQGNKNLTH